MFDFGSIIRGAVDTALAPVRAQIAGLKRSAEGRARGRLRERVETFCEDMRGQQKLLPGDRARLLRCAEGFELLPQAKAPQALEELGKQEDEIRKRPRGIGQNVPPAPEDT